MITDYIEYNFDDEQMQNKYEQTLTFLENFFTQKKGNCLLLVDMFVLQGIERLEAFTERLLQKERYQFEVDHPHVTKSIPPWLIELDLSQSEDYEIFKISIYEALYGIHPEMIEYQGGRVICGWLYSKQPTKLVAKKLGRFTLQQRAPSRYSIIRFYDPAVIDSFIGLLTPHVKTRFLSPVEDWITINGDGERLHYSAEPSEYPDVSDILPLSKQDWAHIDNIVVINLTLKAYRKKWIDHPRYTEFEAHRILQQLLQRLRLQFPTLNNQDLMFYCRFALEKHPNFDQLPLIQNIFGHYGYDEFKIREALLGITEEFWESVKQQEV